MVLSLLPHTDSAKHDSAKIFIVTFILICLMYYFYLRLLSIFTPKKIPKVFALIIFLLFKVKSIYNSAFLQYDKYTSWYLIESNFKTCHLAQTMLNICISFSNWQSCKILGLVASKKTSLQNLLIVIFLLVIQHISIKSTL